MTFSPSEQSRSASFSAERQTRSAPCGILLSSLVKRGDSGGDGFPKMQVLRGKKRHSNGTVADVARCYHSDELSANKAGNKKTQLVTVLTFE